MAVNLNPRLSIRPFRSATDTYIAYEWIDRFNDVAEICDMDDAKRLVYARSHLEGQASSWFSAHKLKIKTWSDFEKLFLDRFAASANLVES